MRVLIVGPGAVGASLAAELTESLGDSLHLLARPATYEAIRRNGWKVRGRENREIACQVASDPEMIPPVGLVFLAVKAQDLPPLLPKLLPYMAPNTLFITLQNGISSESVCAQYLPPSLIAGGIAYLDAFQVEPGLVEIRSSARFTFGTLESNSSPAWENAGAFLKESGLSSLWISNIREMKWKKLCWNAVFNPLCVISKLTVGDIKQNQHFRQIGEEIVNEIRQVAAAEGITLPEEIKEKIFSRQKGEGSGFERTRTSMWQDFRQGKSTEIDYLNGAVVQLGKKNGIQTPANEMVSNLVRAMKNPPN